MKKLFVLAVCSILALGASAQIIRTTSSEFITATVPDAPKVENWHHSGIFIDAGIGAMADRWDNLNFGFDVGLGYRWHIAKGWSWEIFRLGVEVGAPYISDTFAALLTTGFRYESKKFKHGGLYVSGNFGMAIPTQFPGAAWDFGLGMKVTRNSSVGLFIRSFTSAETNASQLTAGLAYEYLF